MIPRLEIYFDRAERRLFYYGTKSDTTPKGRNGEYLLNHCRSGLQLALESLRLKPQTGVGMMVYNCHTVMNSISEAGYKPVFVDVTNGLTIDMEDLARKRSQIKVLIVTHLFGIVNDIKAIKALYPDLIIIEDCAHFFNHAIEGDMGVYSVGQGKFPSIGDGGILVVNPKSQISNLQSKIDSLYETLPRYSRVGEMKLFMRLWGKAWMYKPWIYEHVTIRLKGKRDVGNENVREHVVLRKMSHGIVNILMQKRAHYTKDVAERMKNANEILNHKSSIINGQCIIGSNAFMLVVRTEDVAELKVKFATRGVETETHFTHCIDWAKQFGYQCGDCPNAEKLITRLLMIPTYFKI